MILKCRDMIELGFIKNLDGCCCACITCNPRFNQCEVYPDHFPKAAICRKTGKLSNNWSYEVCCNTQEEILKKRSKV